MVGRPRSLASRLAVASLSLVVALAPTVAVAQGRSFAAATRTIAEPPTTTPVQTPTMPEPVPTPGPRIEETAASEDEVVLKNGGFVRGKIAELTPGERVVIQPSTGGEARTIAWGEIDVVRRATGTAPTPAPQPAPAPAPAAVGTEPGVHVDFELTRDADVTLYKVTGEAVAVSAYGSAYAVGYKAVCDSPCGRAVPIEQDARYFVAGERVTPSERFTVPIRDRVTLSVKPGSKALRSGGWILLSLGIAGAVCGAAMLGAGASFSSDSSIKKKVMVAGGAMLGVGLAFTIGGIPMMIVGKTKVTVD